MSSKWIAAEYPQRMALDFPHAIAKLVECGRRHGQKNGVGFYRYEATDKGRPLRRPAPEAHALIAAIQPDGPRSFAAEEIVDRLMLPMIVEAAICLEHGVAQSAARRRS
jgi:3-hydroxyacyl-CoA dehydrogenase/enoyl-CoA hydratase/3-hydroxybutyryl-CoA epimerase/enoyl-CoA isomerase